VIVFCHNDFPNQRVYCNEHYAKVVECGAECDYFVTESSDDVGGWQAAEENVVEPTVDNSNENDLLAVPVLDKNVDVRDKINQLLSEGYQVDDDNEPAPENIPNTQQPSTQAQGISFFP
jgi:hypothetical protein